MATLTLRLKPEDDKIVQELMKRYGVTQASKAITQAFHAAHNELPKLHEQRNQLRTDNQKLRRLLDNLVQDNQRIADAREEFADQVEHTIKELKNMQSLNY